MRTRPAAGDDEFAGLAVLPCAGGGSLRDGEVARHSFEHQPGHSVVNRRPDFDGLFLRQDALIRLHRPQAAGGGRRVVHPKPLVVRWGLGALVRVEAQPREPGQQLGDQLPGIFGMARLHQPSHNEQRAFFQQLDVEATGGKHCLEPFEARVREEETVQREPRIGIRRVGRELCAQRALMRLQRPACQQGASRETARHHFERGPCGRVFHRRARAGGDGAVAMAVDHREPLTQPLGRALADRCLAAPRRGQRAGQLEARIAAGRSGRVDVHGHAEWVGPGAGVEPAPSRSKPSVLPLNYPGTEKRKTLACFYHTPVAPRPIPPAAPRSAADLPPGRRST